MELTEVNMFCKKSLFTIILFFILIIGCAGVPVRPALEENHTVPSGKIEGSQFIGIRYPFNVSVPTNWKMTTEFPEFLKDLGYDKPAPTDNEQTELYIFNPITQSSILIDLTPAPPYAEFSQELQNSRVTRVAGSLVDELREDHGKDLKIEMGTTEPVSLKGVQYAAKKYATYTLKDGKREQGWIYGFTEPYQIFILYVILEKGGANDRQDIREILDSFEVILIK
jgi:hypothetical protein